MSNAAKIAQLEDEIRLLELEDEMKERQSEVDAILAKRQGQVSKNEPLTHTSNTTFKADKTPKRGGFLSTIVKTLKSGSKPSEKVDEKIDPAVPSEEDRDPPHTPMRGRSRTSVTSPGPRHSTPNFKSPGRRRSTGPISRAKSPGRRRMPRAKSLGRVKKEKAQPTVGKPTARVAPVGEELSQLKSPQPVVRRDQGGGRHGGDQLKSPHRRDQGGGQHGGGQLKSPQPVFQPVFRRDQGGGQHDGGGEDSSGKQGHGSRPDIAKEAAAKAAAMAKNKEQLLRAPATAQRGQKKQLLGTPRPTPGSTKFEYSPRQVPPSKNNKTQKVLFSGNENRSTYKVQSFKSPKPATKRAIGSCKAQQQQQQSSSMSTTNIPPPAPRPSVNIHGQLMQELQAKLQSKKDAEE